MAIFFNLLSSITKYLHKETGHRLQKQLASRCDEIDLSSFQDLISVPDMLQVLVPKTTRRMQREMAGRAKICENKHDLKNIVFPRSWFSLNA